MSDAIKHITDDIFFFQEDSTLVHMHCACNTVQLLRHSRFPFSWTMAPPTVPSWTHWLQDLRSHTAARVWVVSQKDRRKSWTDWLNSGNALIQHLSEKMWFTCFPVLPGSAEAQVIRDGTIQRLLIAYFIADIYAKNIKMCSRMSRLQQTKSGTFFETQCTIINMPRVRRSSEIIQVYCEKKWGQNWNLPDSKINAEQIWAIRHTT